MPAIGVKELLEAGVHFGHQTRRWNPKMRRFIFGERDGIYIIDLLQTEELLERARQFAGDLARRGGTILFVGTKKQARDVVQEVAEKSGMPYVNHRWLGGLLTNFQTISLRIRRLHDLERYESEGQLQLLPTRERIAAQADLEKLRANLGGVKNMERVPGAVFVIDLKTEAIAVREAQRLRIPIIGLVDTNCDPDGIDYVIPGNDDAIRSCAAVTRAIGDVVADSYGAYLADEERARLERERREAEEQARREAEEQARREAEEQARQEAEAAAAAAAASAQPEAAAAEAPAPAAARPARPAPQTRSAPKTPPAAEPKRDAPAEAPPPPAEAETPAAAPEAEQAPAPAEAPAPAAEAETPAPAAEAEETPASAANPDASAPAADSPAPEPEAPAPDQPAAEEPSPPAEEPSPPAEEPSPAAEEPSPPADETNAPADETSLEAAPANETTEEVE